MRKRARSRGAGLPGCIYVYMYICTLDARGYVPQAFLLLQQCCCTGSLNPGALDRFTSFPPPLPPETRVRVSSSPSFYSLPLPCLSVSARGFGFEFRSPLLFWIKFKESLFLANLEGLLVYLRSAPTMLVCLTLRVPRQALRISIKRYFFKLSSFRDSLECILKSKK